MGETLKILVKMAKAAIKLRGLSKKGLIDDRLADEIIKLHRLLRNVELPDDYGERVVQMLDTIISEDDPKKIEQVIREYVDYLRTVVTSATASVLGACR